MDRDERAVLLKLKARQMKADLVGIAGMGCFDGRPADQDPRSVFPECRAVVVIARRVLRGSMRGVEEGTNFGSTYGFFGYEWLEDNFLSQTTYDLTCEIESWGFEAVPLFGYSREGMATGQPVAPGKPRPNVIPDIAFAAQAAGLGEMSLGGFFLTRQFGTRQRMAMILTDADLAADAPFEGRICQSCGACLKACPMGAVSLERMKKVAIPGGDREVADVDNRICSQCPNGAMVAAGRGPTMDRLAAACGRACLVQLESAGKCGNGFVNPFRKRKPWALDVFQRPVEKREAPEPADMGCGRTRDRIGQGR